MTGLAAQSSPANNDMGVSQVDGIFLEQSSSSRNELDAARRQHLLAVQSALQGNVDVEEIIIDLTGFSAAAAALVALLGDRT